MFRRSHPFLIAMFLLIASATRQLSAEQPFTSLANVENAALVYWQAFAVLPRLSAEDEELLSKLEKGEKPLRDAKPLLSGCGLALELTWGVTSDTPCRWGLIENGPSTLLPHLAKARLLARLLVLQARYDAESGNHEAAVANLTRALLVARNVDEGVLIQALVGAAIEAMVADAAHAMLPKLDRSLRDQFAESLVKLPPRTTFAQAMGYERNMVANWIRPVMTADAAKARSILREMGDDGDSHDFETMLTGTKQERLQRFEEFVAEYDKIIEASKLPRAEAEQEFKRLAAAIRKSSNPLIHALMPEVRRAYQRHTEVVARFTDLEKVLRAKSAGTSN